MKINIKKLCALTLVLSILISAFSTPSFSAKETQNENIVLENGQSFTMIEDGDTVTYYGVTGNGEVGTDDEPDSITVIDSVEDYNNMINPTSNSKKDISTTGAQKFPSSVDNSQNKYFPEIGNQGGLGSCNFWAQVYYQFTYMMNRDLDIETTPENTYSPQWAYNVVAGPHEFIGPYYYAYDFMKNQGNVFLSQVPYTQDPSSFSPTEDVWMTSINNRIEDYYIIENVGKEDSRITTADDEDLAPFKAALANGEVLAYSTFVNSWTGTRLKENRAAPENRKFVDEFAVVAQDGTEGSHRMTIVGYNDNIWIDINKNNAVDTGEIGAFKVANSWGDIYGNNGFAWVAYDALNEVSSVNGAENHPERIGIFEDIAGIKVLKQGSNADLYLKYTLNTSDRTQSKVELSLVKDGTVYTFPASSNLNHGPSTAYDGSNYATDATMILLLNNADKNITSDNFDDYTISVNFKDKTFDNKKLIVKNAEIVDETKGKTYKLSNTFPFNLDGNEKELKFTESTLNHAVIYYRGYYNPSINYKVGNGNFVSEKGIKMEENLERRGYTHKYVIDLKDSDKATLYFTDENGNIDNNGGQYFTATRGINYYVTENVADPVSIKIINEFDDDVADVDHCCIFNTEASGGYAPYEYKYSITNLQTYEKINADYNVVSEFSHYFREAGQYIITVDVKDHSDAVYTTSKIIEIKDLPFSFASLTTNEGSKFVGERVTFNAMTKNEKIKFIGSQHNTYTFIVMDNKGKVCHNNTTECTTYNMSFRYSEITDSFIPKKAGNYVVNIFSTDGNNEYAQMSQSFTVFDKIIGDANGDGVVSIMDTTTIQLFIANIDKDQNFFSEMADCDASTSVNILDATLIQRHLALLSNCGKVGNIIEYIPPTEPETEAPTEAPTLPPTEALTEAPTEAPTPPAPKNIVTFTNAFNWSGQIYCYYWSDSNTAMTSWPGVAMTYAGTNEHSQSLYTFEVPDDATYIIFSNGSVQTTDIGYDGGEVRYYPISSTDSRGHYYIQTW